MENNLKFNILKLSIFQYTLGCLLLLGCTACIPSVPRVPPEKIKEHCAGLGVNPTQHLLVVDTKKQTMALMKDNKIKKIYHISTSKKGIGQRVHTFQTPQGLHRINEKIGDGVPKYGIFNKRRFVGVWEKLPRNRHRKDFISTRILRLEGLQPGLNRGRDYLGKVVDSEARAIYIHGTTMEWKLGQPSTKGCVHMSADDVIHLFDEVPVGTLVWIN